jgi:adenine phosphoribosyltransferase
MAVTGSATLERDLKAALRTIPDFPKPGISFKDITPVLADPALFLRATDAMADPFMTTGITHVVAVESRGFILGAPVAQRLGAGFVPVRKVGKLPFRTERVEYALEYGTDHLEIHVDACSPNSRVLVVDDVLATGGTAAATCRLVEQVSGRVVGCSFLLSIRALRGSDALSSRRVHVLLEV